MIFLQKIVILLLTALKNCKEHHKIIIITPETLQTRDVNKHEISLYPNPTKDQIYFKNISNLKIENCAIYNILGREISKGDYILLNNNAIDISKLTKGVYLILFKIGTSIFTKKIVKE